MNLITKSTTVFRNLISKWWVKPALAITFVLAGLVGLGIFIIDKAKNQPTVGVTNPQMQWFMYKDFTGYETKNDPNKVDDGANPQGQNTVINNGDRISNRDLGFQIFPVSSTVSSSENGISSMHTFRKRSGENIQMRSSGNILEWFDEAEDTWENLNSGYTTSAPFGFSDYNINTDLTSYTYFGNANQPFSRWTGAHTNINGALSGGETSITVDDTTGFSATGTLRLCGVSINYTGKTATTFNPTSSTPACADNKGIAQAVEEFPENPRGNLYLVTNNRLFISGVTSTPQAIFFSQYGVATNFLNAALVTDGTDDDPGIFNLGEGGGPVTAMAEDEGSIYFFKKTTIRKATLTDGLYTLTNLKPFDGKSQTIGAVNDGTVFSGANGLFFITPDLQIMNLGRVDNVDYPQVIPISDPIKPTIAAANWGNSVGIYWKDKAYFAAKTTPNSTYNDVVFVYNFRIKAWESPIVGWNVSDFTIYDDGNGDDLYFGSATNPNTYVITDEPVDNGLGVSSNWRSKQYDFGIPQSLKEIENVYVEGYIADNTELTISLLLDENGFTQIYTTTFDGGETQYLYDAPSYNVFGFAPFGVERFGSNNDFSGVRKFRVYLNKDFRPSNFYNIQLEFASDGVNQQWEVIRYGFAVKEYSQPENRALYRSFR